MKRFAILLSLYTTAALAQTCDYYPLNTCAQGILGKKTFYDGISVPGGIDIDGGRLTTGDLTVNGDAGVAGNTRLNGVTVLGALSVDAGITTGGSLVAASFIQGSGAAAGNIGVYAKLGVIQSDNTTISLYSSNGGTIASTGQSTAALQANNPSLPQVAFDTTRGLWAVNAGDGGFQAIATATNGYAGGRLSGYYSASDLASTHSDLGIACTRLQHPIVSGSAGRINATVEKAGTTGGTFNIYVKNETNTQILCYENGISCTSAAGQPGNSAACTWDAGVVGDDVCVHVDTTSCTGTDPGMNVTAEY